MGQCRLCHREAELQESHILPRFVWKWLKDSSPTGHLRGSQTPNRRIQDGQKDYLLCWDCEQRFARWEREFASQVFLPLHQNTATEFKYGSWGLQFAASVVWRVLVFLRQSGLNHLTGAQQSDADRAERRWREFLTGAAVSPGSQEVHLIPLDVIEKASGGKLSPFMNRYLLRAAHSDVLAGSRSVLVYAKLCRVLLLGFVQVPELGAWRSSRLAVKRGHLGAPITYTVPGGLYDHMNSRADMMAKTFASLSPTQSGKVQREVEANLDELANSEVFRAMQADVHHSGKDAFRVTSDLEASMGEDESPEN
jgi:hypothetical protein